ncbi:putative membrane protein [Clostridioides difficile P24]|nr:putative membrane protein [Clostridioides difficile CD17]EQJ53399.1 putative membrane protein [Clostridioides difficile P24]
MILNNLEIKISYPSYMYGVIGVQCIANINIGLIKLYS